MQKKFRPNSTAYPNFLFDIMHTLKEGELRILNVIVRQTYGWHKDRDPISLSQMMALTGLSKQGVLDGREGLKNKNVIGFEIVNSITEYFVIEPEELAKNLAVQEVDNVKIEQPASQNRTNLDVHTVDTQKKELQNKSTKESEPSQSEKPKKEFKTFHDFAKHSLSQSTYNDLLKHKTPDGLPLMLARYWQQFQISHPGAPYK